MVPQRLLGSAFPGFSLGIPPKGSHVPGRQGNSFSRETIQTTSSTIWSSIHIPKALLRQAQFPLSTVNTWAQSCFPSLSLLLFFTICADHPLKQTSQLKAWASSLKPSLIISAVSSLSPSCLHHLFQAVLSGLTYSSV